MPSPDSLAGWLEHIQRQHFRSIDLGLARVRRVWHALGGWQPPLVVTVAGTNGKGSSVAMLEAVLTAAGRRTGSYTSPHLVRYNERIRVDGAPLPDEAICAAFARIEGARQGVGLTWFEFGTLAALLAFEEAGVEIAVLEVGMGGRLDAVNMVRNDVALITAIGLDHRRWLGRDRQRIGGEKAGIVKYGGGMVCSDPEPPPSIVDRARRMAARLLRLGADFSLRREGEKFAWRSDSDLVPSAWRRLVGLAPPPGAHQVDNAAGVVAALALLPGQGGVRPEHLRQGLARARLPGRLQAIAGQPEILLDVCHNLESAETLAAWLRDHPVPGRNLAVFGVLGDKPVAEMARLLDACFGRWFLASLEGERGQSSAVLRETLLEAGIGAERMVVRDSPVAAFRAAREEAGKADRVVVFGSFHTVGDIMGFLHLSSD